MPYIHVTQLQLTLHSLQPKVSWNKTILVSQLMANFRLLPYVANLFTFDYEYCNKVYVNWNTIQTIINEKRNTRPIVFHTQLQTNIRDHASIQQCQYVKHFEPYQLLFDLGR